jgi:hypothetical protein
MSRPVGIRPCLYLAICFVWSSVSFQPSLNLICRRRHLHESVSPNNAVQPARSMLSPLYAGSKKNLSASDKERRNEETRRNTRREDVVIGKTSAKKGEKDYAIDPKVTEEEYLRQASKEEKEIFYRTQEGMELLKSVGLLVIRLACPPCHTRTKLSSHNFLSPYP